MFEFSVYHVVLAGLGTAIVFAHWAPRFVSGREPATSALLIALGTLLALCVPEMAQQIDPVASPHAWEVVSELCVVIGLFGVGLRIDRLRSRRQWKPAFRLLAFAMPLTIAALAAAGVALAGLSLFSALLLGAILAPTDPVLAGDVQVGPPGEGGEHPVRFALTTEAGLNDGLAFPFVHLALALIAAGAVTADVLGDWLWRDVVYRIVVGVAAGGLIGWLLGKLMFDWPRDNPLAQTESGLVALAGVLVTYGFTELIEGYGFIASFVAGLALRRSESHHEFHMRLHAFSQSIEHALTALLLVALGASIPRLLPALDASGAAIAVGLVLLVRPLSGWVSLAGAMRNRSQRAVVAFYGVRGIGSIYYLAFACSSGGVAQPEMLWAITACTIVMSTVVHGFTGAAAVEKATGEAAAAAR